MTTFVSASFQNVSARFSHHSFSETVYFTSLSLFGLISLFHFYFSLKISYFCNNYYCIL